MVGLEWTGLGSDWISLDWIRHWNGREEMVGIGMDKYGQIQVGRHTIGLTKRIRFELTQKVSVGASDLSKCSSHCSTLGRRCGRHGHLKWDTWRRMMHDEACRSHTRARLAAPPALLYQPTGGLGRVHEAGDFEG